MWIRQDNMPESRLSWRDENGDAIPKIEAEIRKEADKIFPPDRFHVTITGKALVFQKGTGYLLDNLLSVLDFCLFPDRTFNRIDCSVRSR